MRPTKAQLYVLALANTRPDEPVTIWYVGRQVAGCHIRDPRGNGGVTAAEMDELEDWPVSPRILRHLVKLGFLQLKLTAQSLSVGYLSCRYEFYELTDAGRAAARLGAADAKGAKA